MARRRNDSGSSVIWPGFVDAMTALLLVVMFVLSIFMVVQFVLREELIGKDRSLQELGETLVSLRAELSSERRRAAGFENRVASLEELLAEEEARALELGRELAAAQEQNVALSAELEQRIAELAATAEAMAEREAAFARVAEIEQQNAELRQSQLTLEERLAALELALDEKRAEAEETLLLLAAAEAKQAELSADAIEQARKLTDQERLNAFARAALDIEQEATEEQRKAIALLNGQIRDLREQIAALEFQLRLSETKEAEAQVQIQDLGARLNKALARKVDELQRYRSEFFGRMRDLLANRDDIRIVGDRFVFQSEVLFESGSAELGPEGKEELAKFAAVLRDLALEIPAELPWILRVDGHTDVVPIGRSSIYADNWELSQARALSVVSFLTGEQGISARRLAAAGFGEFQPLDPARSREAYRRNRRIELKLTER